MSLNVSGLSAYVELKSKEIALKAIGNATTARLLIDSGNVQAGVKGTAAILKMSNTATFQSGASCGRTASGETVLTDAVLTVVPLKDIQNICPKTLYSTHYAFALKAGQDVEGELDQAFAQQIMDDRVSKVAEANELAIWQGDTGGSGNLAFFNGILKQVAAGSYTDLDNTASTVLGRLQSANSKVPIKLRKSTDFRIFLGEDMYDQYIADLGALNIFKPVEDMKLYATTSILVPTPGLNTTGKVVATRLSNLQLGLDMEGEADKAILRYSMETDQWYADIHWALGVSVVYPISSEICYANLSDATLTTTTTTAP